MTCMFDGFFCFKNFDSNPLMSSINHPFLQTFYFFRIDQLTLLPWFFSSHLLISFIYNYVAMLAENMVWFLHSKAKLSQVWQWPEVEGVRYRGFCPMMGGSCMIENFLQIFWSSQVHFFLYWLNSSFFIFNFIFLPNSISYLFLNLFEIWSCVWKRHIC